ncbi:NAD dependent epimerase dehydratase [Fusarium albosuccineum]|uniref:NAD dependent epimerase dehydratase n=1 Tax=Fusarium albosuccineum TaxID=1237068 RepID=A0A8H4LPW5_9HYPO|nr:NAD dependent epimerase dehydratase [Fusarium albosuccineum]
MATVGILKSAAKVPSIKRVVITSSMATLLSWDYIISDDRDRAYGPAKALALVATEKFIQEEKPHFDVINLLPSMVIGRNELNTSKEEVASGTNNGVMGPLIGAKSEMPTLGASVHLNDVSRAHIDVLNPLIPGNRNFPCSSGGLQGTTWDDAKDIARRRFGKSVSDGTCTLDGTFPTRPLRLDASEAEDVLGWKFAGFEGQV